MTVHSIFNRTGTLSYGGVISGSGSVTKSGTGTVTLTGDSTYTGGTTITAGTVQLGNGRYDRFYRSAMSSTTRRSTSTAATP